MRGMIVAGVIAFCIAIAAPARVSAAAAAVPSVSAAPVLALQIPDKKIEITVGDRGASAAWYRSPVWMAIGILAVVVILLIVVLLARGGGTTIIRD